MLRINAAIHVWSEYMRLMPGEKKDDDEQNSIRGKEVESMRLCVAKLDARILTFFEGLGLEQTVEQTDRNTTLRSFKSFIP